MRTIVLNCTDCGSINSVPTGALLVSVDIADLGAHLAGAVCWICSGCAQVVIAPVEWLQLLHLLSAGVPLLEDGLALADVASALPPHPENPLASGAFTPDDLLELHELLAIDTWFPILAALASHG